MKYKLKIVPEGSQFIGYALENDEVVFQTNPCRDSIAASRELSKLINNEQPVSFSNKPVQVGTLKPQSSTPTPAPLPAPIPTPRKCCGRG